MSLRDSIETVQIEFENNTDINERRKYGQFFTPIEMATEIAEYGVSLLSGDIHYLEPAFGLGAFYYALKNVADKRVISATGVEQDSSLFQSAKELWSDSSIDLIKADFTLLSVDKITNLLITNPPYVRHHLLSATQKEILKNKVEQETGLNISGLAGLYCYFLLLADKWLAEGGISGWLIPSEFMDVNYGECIKEYLLKHVRLLRIHRYNPLSSQFDDALVSSCVVWYKKEKSDEDYDVEFTYGGTHQSPEIRKTVKKSILLSENKWTRFPEKDIRSISDRKSLKDYFDVKRGIATGDNDFFIMTREKIEQRKLDMSMFVPILPSPRKMRADEVFADEDNFPIIEPQLFLLKCDLPQCEVMEKYPRVWEYLQTGLETTSKKYLCKNRKEWYWQENRTATPFLCSYMGRSSGECNAPFRFILNHSDAIVTNTYLMLYPKKMVQDKMKKNPSLVRQIWKCLQSITADDFESEGRVYGGGLRKIEPRELGKIHCIELDILFEQ